MTKQWLSQAHCLTVQKRHSQAKTSIYLADFGANGPTDNAIGFTGHIKDASGFTYMEARFYDPVSGRFLSNGPLPYRDIFSFNRYSYANNNPYKVSVR